MGLDGARSYSSGVAKPQLRRRVMKAFVLLALVLCIAGCSTLDMQTASAAHPMASPFEKNRCGPGL